MTDAHLKISEDDWLDVQNIALGAFAPLTGFMNENDYRSVVREMKLVDGTPWTLPVTLAFSPENLESVKRNEKLTLIREATGAAVADLLVTGYFKVDYSTDIAPVYGVTTTDHPGVRKETGRSTFRVSGTIRMHAISDEKTSPYFYTPAETKRIFGERGWKKITGFQTRNPIHRAHEHLQRIALEVTDGLFVQPLVGWKKAGDFTSEAVISAYGAMSEHFYPANRVLVGTLNTQMRYAGPREAVFHAIIRRNYGCTHFIVGRDHAGVGGYYGKYESQNLCLAFGDKLGIEILALGGPFFCHKCLSPATEHTCGHTDADRVEISGTLIRKMLSEGKRPPVEFMRNEIADVLIELQKRGQLFY